MRRRANLTVEQLDSRVVPTLAIFSNGTLTVLGDNLGNQINVAANAAGNLQVTERGQAVPILGGAATTANTKLVTEIAGTGNDNTLMTDKSLGPIADSLVGNGTGTMTFAPGNNAPSLATGSPGRNTVNDFISNPGGKDVFVGGEGANVFDWEPGTGTDTYIGAGQFNVVQVVGNAGGQAEQDSLAGDGQGGVIYSRNNLVPFKIFASDIQVWNLEPSTGAGNAVTIGDLSGTGTKAVVVNESNGSVDASAQLDRSVALVVNGTNDAVIPGAGPTIRINRPWLLAADIVERLERRE